mgnify:CR=1 FL=1
MITATGYRLIITTNAQMDAGKAATHLLSGLCVTSTRADVAAAMSTVLHPKTVLVAVTEGEGEDASDGGSFMCFDPSQQVGRDARVWATVRCLKLDPSTPFEHTRNALWHLENHRSDHIIPGTNILKPFYMLIVDGGGDENPRFVQQIMCLTVLFLRRGAEYLVAMTAAAGFTPYRLVEFAQSSFSGTLDGVRIQSDTFGKPQLEKDGKPRNQEEAQLEEKNLRYACDEMCQYLDGSEALNFPVAAFVPPKPSALSPFATIDERAFTEYRNEAGGCTCKTGCSGGRCRSCFNFKEGLRTCPRPCTWRCKCKGCTNPTPFPPPQNLSALELQTLPLPDIIARLTPRDIEYFASQHGCLLHYATMLKLCDPDVASNCWYCSRYGQRLLPISLQRHFLPLYPTVGSDGTFTPFAKRWDETLANKGQAYISDESLVSRIISAAYAQQVGTARAEPPDALVASLAKQTLLEPKSVRALFKKHNEQATRLTRWVTPHQVEGADADVEAVLDNGVLKYDDGSLVGRRCTAFVSPEDGDDSFEEGYYAATIVAFNSRASSHKGRYLLHFDDGQRERVDLPDDTVRIMTACVSICRCQDSPGHRTGCGKGQNGSEALPRPWEADPK